ncbi:hypothetical protein AO917_17040 [Pseudomonas aeruginosa]|nr:hypothetical protein BH78_07485 [Pseudomonas aeruginosa C1913C]KSE47376.1 hypothetical protein AO917_17040 [Pseudomonas aeruginosa]OFM13079.1 hypothetical protein HMPREF2716_00460 [Pseudomonas sp. HMSC076A11]KSE97713.1 hypothetical protein AO934_13790 [Pseudomonas aeruginosa]OFJ91368.1 hypothetical protein HMPREF2840_14095 [Pseudomonas aeruginosa]
MLLEQVRSLFIHITMVTILTQRNGYFARFNILGPRLFHFMLILLLYGQILLEKEQGLICWHLI